LGFAALQGRDLSYVLVDASDLMTEIGKAGADTSPTYPVADHCERMLSPSLFKPCNFAGLLAGYLKAGKQPG